MTTTSSRPFIAAILNDPAAGSAWLGRDPYARELTYARIAAETEHLVLSTKLSHATWPTARFIRDINELRAVKGQAGNADNTVRRPALLNNPPADRASLSADAISHAHLTNGPPYQVCSVAEALGGRTPATWRKRSSALPTADTSGVACANRSPYRAIARCGWSAPGAYSLQPRCRSETPDT
jgi:hypothetical protein